MTVCETVIDSQLHKIRYKRSWDAFCEVGHRSSNAH